MTALPKALSATRTDVKRAQAERSLLRFITWRTPLYLPPRHLQPLINLLERIARGEVVRAVVHAPPRHSKTETILHAIAWLLWKNPRLEMGYFTYASDIAGGKSKVAMDIALGLGIELVTKNKGEWLTAKRGGLRARSITEGMTGHGMNVGFIDDPVKDRLWAESARMRQRIVEWAEAVYFTRLEPGASGICLMTRWHPDDLAGWLIKEKGWEYIKLQALDDNGNALWPERWPAEAMKARREEVGPYVWASLFQGEPRPRGGTVFGDPWGYESLPQFRRYSVGMDLAFSESTSSDYSVLVVMAKFEGYFYVLDVVRDQMRAPVFAQKIADYRRRYPLAKFRWYAAGTEKGVADFIAPLVKEPLAKWAFPPRGDKFTRAIAYAAAWNAGKILLPDLPNQEPPPWLNPFVAEHATFTGVNDDHDDQVDAAVAAYDALVGQSEKPRTEPRDTAVLERRM